MQTPLRCGHLVLSFGVCIRRSNCKTDSSVMWTLSSVSLVSVSGGFDCNTDTSVMWTLGSVPLVSVSGGSIVIQTPL